MEYFLRCQNCQHLNPVHSEFLTFCEQCKKKLPNNFREWSKTHAGKTLEDFKHEVCLSEEEKNRDVVEVKSRSGDGWKHWVNISITLAVFIGIWPFYLLFLIGDSNLQMIAQQYVGAASSDFDWHWEEFEDYGIRLETPVKLHHTKINVPPQQAGLVERIDSYSSNPLSQISVVVVNNEFNPSVGDLDMKAVAAGSVTQMKAIPGASGFDFSQQEISIDDITGIRQDGSFQLLGQARGFTTLDLSRGQIIWQIIVVYQLNDLFHQQARDRIVKSIEIADAPDV